MLADKETRDIQAYLCGTLPRSRREVFERRLQEESALRQRLAKLAPILIGLEAVAFEDHIQAVIEQGADRVNESADKNRLDLLPEKDKAFVETCGNNQPDIITFPDRPKQPVWLQSVYVTAACLAILLGIGWADYSQPSRLYKTYYHPIISRGGTPAGCPERVIIHQYDLGQFRAALENLMKEPRTPCVLFYSGMSYLGLNQPVRAIPFLQQAITDSTIGPSAVWYLSLAYIKHRDRANALNLLAQIARDPASPYAMRAAQLQSDYKKPILFTWKF